MLGMLLTASSKLSILLFKVTMKTVSIIIPKISKIIKTTEKIEKKDLLVFSFFFSSIFNSFFSFSFDNFIFIIFLNFIVA